MRGAVEHVWIVREFSIESQQCLNCSSCLVEAHSATGRRHQRAILELLVGKMRRRFLQNREGFSAAPLRRKTYALFRGSGNFDYSTCSRLRQRESRQQWTRAQAEKTHAEESCHINKEREAVSRFCEYIFMSCCAIGARSRSALEILAMHD